MPSEHTEKSKEKSKTIILLKNYVTDSTFKSRLLKNVKPLKQKRKFLESYKENVMIIASWVFVENNLPKTLVI